MKSFVAIASTFALLANAQLIYDASDKSIECPKASGTFCVGPASGLLVTCTNGVGTMSLCGGSATCSETSSSSGDAVCSTTPKYSNSTGPWVMDSAAADCDCDEPAPPPPSSTPVGPIVTSSRWANTSTPCTTTTSSSTPVQPVIPSSTPCETTPVAPVIPSSKPITSSWGTGTGYPHHTANATTLNSSWKPSLTGSSSTTPSSTIAAPIQANAGAVNGKSIPVLAIAFAGILAALV